jgi:transcriptional regulator with XRE-family HTH domain
MEDTQEVDGDYEEFLKLIAERIKTLRKERNLSLRDMVVGHGYHDSNYRRIERDGAGGILSLLRICKAFGITLCQLLDGLGEYPKQNLAELSRHVHDQTRKATQAKASKSKTKSAARSEL